MTDRLVPPFRADHVGSLLRPAELRAARAARAEGRVDAIELRAVEDRAIADAVAMQEGLGLRGATDGEFRRTSWHMDFIYQLGGIHQTEGTIPIAFRNRERSIEFTPAAISVSERVHLEHPIFADAFTFVRDSVRTATAKLTIPSPSMVHYRGGRASIDEAIYPDLDAFWADLVHAYRDEVAALASLGCTYLQFDDTALAYLNDPVQRTYIAAQGGDPLHQHETYIEQLNEVLAGRPEGMTVTTHLCRGNFASSWAAEGGYDFAPLRFVPSGKIVVLGLVSSKVGALENADELKRRVDAAARFIPLDQICLSPQCGFSSTIEGNELSEDEQRSKLALVVDVAEAIWG